MKSQPIFWAIDLKFHLSRLLRWFVLPPHLHLGQNVIYSNQNTVHIPPPLKRTYLICLQLDILIIYAEQWKL